MTSRAPMTVMSLRRDSRSPGAPPPDDGRRARTFHCRDDLFDAFVARADSLECSVDWLLAEAMKRLLRDMPKPSSLRLPPPPPPPPPPPRPQRPQRKQAGSFVGAVERAATKIALRVGGMTAAVDRDRFVLGRSARDANLPLRDGGVSRQHAMIERDASGAFTIVDMASTNGVHVNGVRVTRAPIRAGDVIVIGPFEIAVVTDER